MSDEGPITAPAAAPIPAWLTTCAPPAFVMMRFDESDMTNTLWAWERQVPGLVQRMGRGQKCRTARGLYDEISAALQFPYYFGENAAALDECLRDLVWLPAKAFVVGILHADELLADEEAGSFARFIKLLDAAARHWAAPSANDQAFGAMSMPFHIVLQTSEGSALMLGAKLNAAGVSALVQ